MSKNHYCCAKFDNALFHFQFSKDEMNKANARIMRKHKQQD